MNFNEHVYYDETSPTYLRWKTNRYWGTPAKILRASAGDVAGSICINKDDTIEVRIKLCGKRYQVHRIVWEIFNGPVPPDMVVDHLDGNRQNNDKSNLECKKPVHNRQNMKMNKENTSGVTGVNWVLVRQKYTYASANVRDGLEVLLKTFSVHKYGLLPAFKMAYEWRMLQVQRLNDRGAMYTFRGAVSEGSSVAAVLQ